MKISIQGENNPDIIRAFEKWTGKKFISIEAFKGEKDGHIFSPGEKAELIGLESYPQFNGEVVTITSIREDGEYGRAYYFATDNDALAECLNWTYEYRLKKYQPNSIGSTIPIIGR